MSGIDEPINKAMQDGQFDNLPGKGKPLNLDDNPLADPEWQLAQHMLKESGFSLPWIEARREIEKDLEEARSDLSRTWEWRQAALAQNRLTPQVEGQWQQSLKAFRERITLLNKRIRDYNLQAPSDKFHIFLLNSEKEISSITSG